MTQTNRSILGATAYRNPQHIKEAAEFEAANKEADAQDPAQDQDTVDPSKQEPQHNWEKRYKDLQSYNSRMINSLKSEIEDLKKQGTPTIALPKSAEELAAFREKNPDTYAFIETMATQISQEQLKGFDQKLASVQGDLRDTKADRAMAQLKTEHPDYEAIIVSDVFRTWAQHQSQEVQDWIYNNPDDASKASRALSLFKYETGLGKQTNSQDPTPREPQAPQGDGSAAVNVNGASNPEITDPKHPGYIWKESDIAKMRPDVYVKYADDIDLANKEGRILHGQ